MNELVLEALRHNTWATKRLLESCRSLQDDQLSSAGIGTYGGILATLHHIIRAEAGYVSRILGIPRSALASSDSTDFDVLDSPVEETAGLGEVPGARQRARRAGAPPRERASRAGLLHPHRAWNRAAGRPSLGLGRCNWPRP